MKGKAREDAANKARTVISRRKIFDPITVGLARAVLDYEAALSELANTGVGVIAIGIETA